jgi:hypothetical protein
LLATVDPLRFSLWIDAALSVLVLALHGCFPSGQCVATTLGTV